MAALFAVAAACASLETEANISCPGEGVLKQGGYHIERVGSKMAKHSTHEMKPPEGRQDAENCEKVFVCFL